MLGPAITGLFYVPIVQYYLLIFAVLCRNFLYFELASHSTWGFNHWGFNLKILD